MITQDKVNSAVNKVINTNEKINDTMDGLHSKVLQSRNWWQGRDYDSFLEKYQKIRSLSRNLQKELSTLKAQLRILSIEVASEEWKKKQAQNRR